MDGDNTPDSRKVSSQEIENFVNNISVGDALVVAGIRIAPFYRRRQGQDVIFDGLDPGFINKFFAEWCQ
jgi:hypothetical protein